ncbi:glucosamine-6-phosphate deaminase [Dethiosulfatibacter aminovorans DSM 17477]|uniref:Glucosamine-6-phosphate deaminase n=1 Tax=Dethiosulfatibacter aminovorans DSM 17477 TaxID=1121476 RepID=A0A1M6E612_9FIRM|nr:glucosamine-6-phosphate deaminase [Dethiosulfatibacter aminovorans]SHI80937.1 glucosamine-6-phosphate deaminase [Dethiosulfatibacter aminovorans DSM 17477]
MRIIAVDNIEDMGEAAADLIIEKIISKPDCVLGLATGSTPLSLYIRLIRAYEQKTVSYKEVKSFNLDEYRGLEQDNPNSYHYYMKENLFKYIDILPENTYLPSGTMDADEAIRTYKELLKDHQIDIQVLGIGTNGHIGFNEPGVSFESSVHLVELDEQTIEDNSRYFESLDDVPKQAITMGIADIMAAKSIILMAGTENKKNALRCVLEGPVTDECPASILRKHKGLTIVALKNVLNEISLNLL